MKIKKKLSYQFETHFYQNSHLNSSLNDVMNNGEGRYDGEQGNTIDKSNSATQVVLAQKHRLLGLQTRPAHDAEREAAKAQSLP